MNRKWQKTIVQKIESYMFSSCVKISKVQFDFGDYLIEKRKHQLIVDV